MQDTPLALTVEQVAERLQIGRGAAYRLVGSGEIRSIRIGKLIRVPLAALEDYIS